MGNCAREKVVEVKESKDIKVKERGHCLLAFLLQY